MLIDWFTVGAQALNFLILVWLMKRFLYKPINSAIEAREKLIAKELSDAAASKAEAQKDRDDFQAKNSAFDKERAALVSKASDEAKAESKKILDEARVGADSLQTKRMKALAIEAGNINQSITRRTLDEVFAVARKALSDLAGVDLEERIGTVFIGRLRALDGSAKDNFGCALKSDKGVASVRSTFALSEEQRGAMLKAINETFSMEACLHFETTPDQVSGIVLTCGGQTIEWSIDKYLDSMEKHVAELLKGEHAA